MPGSRSMFSDSWHRVSNQHIRLRPNLLLQKQRYRGDIWYVLRDPFTNQFFRFRRPAYHFIAMLDGRSDLDTVWKRCLERFPEEAPGQEEVIQLLAQLYRHSLIQSEISPDSKKLFERRKRHQQTQARNTLTSILFIRVPLWDPDAFLKRTLPFVNFLMGRIGLLLWAVVVGIGIKIVAENWSLLLDRTQQVLAPDNLILLLISFILIKTLHEFGHAYFTRKYGGEVHTMGIMFLVFNPIPYCDATSAWAFQQRSRRVMVGFAGMVVEVFFAALATMVWINTDAGLIHNMAYNIMFIASVGTFLFNINPLLRFDGYYILSDLTDTPNLQNRSRQELHYYVERYAFGHERAVSVAKNRGESIWLITFGICSAIYRIFIFAVIILFVADKYFGLGLIAGIIGFFGLFILPLYKFIRYLIAEPRIQRVRKRAIGVTVTTVAALFMFLWYFPFPSHFRAPGQLKTDPYAMITTGTVGTVSQPLLDSGTWVEEGDVILAMSNPELVHRIQATRARIAGIRTRINLALTENQGELRALRRLMLSEEKQLAEYQARLDALQIRAPISGWWVSPGTRRIEGSFLERGTRIGQIIRPTNFTFEAVVRQQHASRLWEEQSPRAVLRFPGQSGIPVHVDRMILVPAKQTRLPTPTLGWSTGGPIRVDPTDPEGIVAAEPYFKVITTLEDNPSAKLLHGQTGWARFQTAPEPLLRQWIRQFRQLLQSRYQI